MTLILNEIHLQNGMKKTFIIAAADRRISKPNGTFDSIKRKVFGIPYFNGAVSYFGLAVVYPKGNQQYISTWLPSFVRRQYTTDSLKSFAENLRDELNKIVPSSILKNNPSGFHICGYESSGLPDFYYLSNCRLGIFKYVDLKPRYKPPESHFLSRDASEVFNWDGINPLSAKCGVLTYRHGDFRAHVAAWESLDKILKKMFQFPDFKQPSSPSEYKEYVKFKFEFIAFLYKKWADRKIIGRPIDVLVLNPPKKN